MEGSTGKSNVKLSYRKLLDKTREVFGASKADWHDWKWQLSNRISDVAALEEISPLTQK